MVHSNGWSVVVAKSYGRSNAQPTSRCRGDAHLSDSLFRSIRLRWSNGNSRSKVKRKCYASTITLFACKLRASHKLACKAKIPPRSWNVPITSQLSYTKSPRNHANISWNDCMKRWRMLRCEMFCIMHRYCHNCLVQLRSMRTTLAWNPNLMQHLSKWISKFMKVSYSVKYCIL